MCQRPTEQDWWCAFCGEFYSEAHSSAYEILSTTEAKNIQEIIDLLSLVSFTFRDSWPDELADTLSKDITLQKETDGVTVKGFSIADLLTAIRTAFTKR